MISLQRLLVSALLFLTVTFVFFAQSAEATKGPKITHKVCTQLHLELSVAGGTWNPAYINWDVDSIL